MLFSQRLRKSRIVRPDAPYRAGEVASPAVNAERTRVLAQQSVDTRAVMALFPELGLSAYSIEDLTLQDALLDAVEIAIVHGIDAVILPKNWQLLAGAPPSARTAIGCSRRLSAGSCSRRSPAKATTR